MDCNKEEAIHAMEIAVKRLYDRDYAGAKQIALKVEKLYPQLDNISQLLTVCEVHSSAQLMSNGLHDWYKIIQVDPHSDDIVIKKQYRKLALSLHPDKNKLPGAEAAFKLVGEANNILSNRAKRVMYDVKRSHLVWSTTESRENARSNGAKKSSQPPQQTQGTFWTSCPYCSTNHQYYRHILFKTVRCICCSEKFQAYAVPHLNPGLMSGYYNRSPMKPENNNRDTNPTVFNSSGTNSVTYQRKTVPPFLNQYSSRRSQPKFNKDINGKSKGIAADGLSAAKKARVEANEKQDNNDGMGAAFNTSSSKVVGATAEMDVKEQNKEKEKGKGKGKERVEVEPSVSESDKNQTNKGNAVCNSMNLNLRRRSLHKKPDVVKNNITGTTDVLSPALKARVNMKGVQDGKSHIDASNTCTKAKAKAKASTTVQKEVKKKQNREKKGNEQVGLNESTKDNNLVSGTINIGACVDSSPNTSKGKFSQQSVAAEKNLYEYPDAEFHNFDMCRTNENFHMGQIWALYSELDTYPKYYGYIREVEYDPFKVHVSWLEACLYERGWLDADLPLSCGGFKVTDEGTVYDKTDYFSHMVTVRERGDECYEILPDTGEIWAVYKDWSAKWTLHDLMTCEFDIVQVRKQSKEFIEVLAMEKVPQYRSVFVPVKQVDDGSGLNTLEIPAFMFSHRIPAIRLTEENGGKLRGFWELDPASVPYAFFES